jgi:hypothetical protein
MFADSYSTDNCSPGHVFARAFVYDSCSRTDFVLDSNDSMRLNATFPLIKLKFPQVAYKDTGLLHGIQAIIILYTIILLYVGRKFSADIRVKKFRRLSRLFGGGLQVYSH